MTSKIQTQIIKQNMFQNNKTYHKIIKTLDKLYDTPLNTDDVRVICCDKKRFTDGYRYASIEFNHSRKKPTKKMTDIIDMFNSIEGVKAVAYETQERSSYPSDIRYYKTNIIISMGDTDSDESDSDESDSEEENDGLVG